MTKLSNNARGFLITSVGVLVLTPDGLLIRLIETDHLTLLFWRGLLLSTSLTIFYIIRYRKTSVAIFKKTGVPGIFCGLFFSGNSIFFVTSITLTSVANTLVIVSMSPLFGAIFSHIFLKETAPLRTWMAIILCSIGVLIVFSGSLGKGALLGDICAVGTAICMASYFVIARHSCNVDMIPTLILSGLIVALLMLPFATPFSISLNDLLFLLLLCGVILPLSFGLITIGPRYIPASEVGIIMLLETVLGPLWVWWIIGEVPSSATLLGGTFVIMTIMIHFILGFRELKIS